MRTRDRSNIGKLLSVSGRKELPPVVNRPKLCRSCRRKHCHWSDVGDFCRHSPEVGIMKLTSLDQCAFATMLLERSTHGTAPIDDGQEGLLEVQSPAGQPVQQLIADLLILGGSLME